MKPIEAMARALCRHNSVGRMIADWHVDAEAVEEEVEERWRIWIGFAQAALTALRDNGVTEGMWMSWLDSNDMNATQTECNRQFRAMLDAALGEG